MRVHHTLLSSTEGTAAEAPLQILGPNTPNKHGTKIASATTSAAIQDDMQEDEEVQPLKHKHKKE